MKGKIKAVIFDYGRVLGNYDYSDFFSEIKKYSSFSQKKVTDILGYSKLHDDYHNGKISTKNFYKETVKNIQASGLSYEKFKKIWKSVIRHANKEIEEILASVKPGIKLFILSNTNELHWEAAGNIKSVKKYFPNKKQKILPFELGISKPEKNIFKEMLRRTNCLPGECVYIDDQSRHLKAAKKIDINTILYDCRIDTIKELKKSLSKYDILIKK